MSLLIGQPFPMANVSHEVSMAFYAVPVRRLRLSTTTWPTLGLIPTIKPFEDKCIPAIRLRGSRPIWNSVRGISFGFLLWFFISTVEFTYLKFAFLGQCMNGTSVEHLGAWKMTCGYRVLSSPLTHTPNSSRGFRSSGFQEWPTSKG